MALTVTAKHWRLAFSLIFLSVFTGKFAKADEDLPLPDGALVYPGQVVAKALICFNDKYIYSSCEEAYRLTQTGNLNVPPEYTDQYCSGPCKAETTLVLNCIENIFSHFLFYNKATIQDVGATIKAGCGFGSQRGNFNVEEHIQDEESDGGESSVPVMVGLVGMILGNGLVFLV
ncbi:Glutamate synthase 1 [NADH] like [Actinidia chinensis var. chinensis]|uniref:Glutamate synthase 1 [NADH] like n=1 Tax=Actinidia chinensis var. chinensis TaxID=1590841 RepID=A0A2R6PJM2_ACTCC|nr:Glutamate synthase 1 [NADH] like [Actinidia chinensis var. chinensis]